VHPSFYPQSSNSLLNGFGVIKRYYPNSPGPDFIGKPLVFCVERNASWRRFLFSFSISVVLKNVMFSCFKKIFSLFSGCICLNYPPCRLWENGEGIKKKLLFIILIFLKGLKIKKKNYIIIKIKILPFSLPKSPV